MEREEDTERDMEREKDTQRETTFCTNRPRPPATSLLFPQYRQSVSLHHTKRSCRSLAYSVRLRYLLQFWDDEVEAREQSSFFFFAPRLRLRACAPLSAVFALPLLPLLLSISSFACAWPRLPQGAPYTRGMLTCSAQSHLLPALLPILVLRTPVC